MQPEPEPDVNWGVIRDWLQDCCANHKGDVNKEADSTIIPQMRVFDVEEGCVVMAPPHCKYASLSYVWGKPSDQDLSARTENITNLEKKGYLYKNLPTATFHDAVVAWAKIGLRYLGTDRLCILQDAIQDKHSQVNTMDVIYSCSVVTLVALAGMDVHHYNKAICVPSEKTLKKRSSSEIDEESVVDENSPKRRRRPWKQQKNSLGSNLKRCGSSLDSLLEGKA